MREPREKITNFSCAWWPALACSMACFASVARSQEGGRRPEIVNIDLNKNPNNPVAKFKILIRVFNMINCNAPFNSEMVFNELSKLPGHEDPEILWALGMSYYYGYGTARNRKIGIEFFEKSAAKNSVDSLIELGKFYSRSNSNTSNEKISQVFFQKAYDILLVKAQNGDIDAIENIYFNDFKARLPLERIDDAHWRARLLELNSARFLAAEGASLVWPNRPIEDIQKGVILLNKSASQHDFTAIASLINIYENGIIFKGKVKIQKNKKLCEYWTNKAIELFGCDLAEFRNTSE